LLLDLVLKVLTLFSVKHLFLLWKRVRLLPVNKFYVVIFHVDACWLAGHQRLQRNWIHQILDGELICSLAFYFKSLLVLNDHILALLLGVLDDLFLNHWVALH
jgi:uncharacterized membrane protein YhhN